MLKKNIINSLYQTLRKMKNGIFILFIGFLFMISCQRDFLTDSSTEPVLLFKSGFEDGIYINNTTYPDNEDYRYIRGTDYETGFSWPVDILGGNGNALHCMDDDNHKAVMSEIQTLIGHIGNLTKKQHIT